MKFLGTLLKTLLALLLLVVVLAAFTFLAWRMRWPVFTGVFIVAGLIACALLFFVVRFVWRLRNKRRFVQQALAGLRTDPGNAPVGDRSAMETLWSTLLDQNQCPGTQGFLDRICYLALDATGAASPLFTHVQKKWDAQQRIARHDFAQTTLLQLTQSILDGEEKEEILTLLARDIRNDSLRGLILLVSANEIEGLSEQTLLERGFTHRAQLHELIAAVNRSIPLYVLVQDIDRLPGGALLLSRPGVSENWPGCFFDEAPEAAKGAAADDRRFGEEAAISAEASLRAALYDDLVERRPPWADELVCLDRIRELGGKLDRLFAGLLQFEPRRDPLRLAGIFFCRTENGEAAAGTSAESTKPANSANSGNSANSANDPAEDFPPSFVTSKSADDENALPHIVLSRFFARVLPSNEAENRALSGRAATGSTAWIVGMSAWFLLLLCVCGLLAASTLYQRHAITTVPALDREISAHISPLYRQMRYIEQLENARAHWLLPKIGLGTLTRTVREEKRDFSRRMHAQILTPLIRNLRDSLEATRTESYTERQHAALTQLTWLAGNLAERLKKGKTSDTASNIFFPITTQDGWNTVGSELIDAGLNWTDDRAQLEILSSEVGGALAQFIYTHFDVFSNSIIEYYNNANIDQRVCLSHYWSHISETSDTDFCVPAYYTAASHRLNSAFFSTFLTTSPGETDALRLSGDKDARNDAKIHRMLDAHLKRYAEYWETFVRRFCEAAVSAESASVYTNYSTLKNLRRTPHLRLIDRLNREFEPLQHANPPPRWMKDAHLFEVMLGVALEGHASNDPAGWHTLLMAGVHMPDALRTLWEKADNQQHMREIYDAIMGMTLYLSSVHEILGDIGNPPLSLSLARLHFGRKDVEALKKSPFTLAEARLVTTDALFRDSGAPQVAVFKNLLDFSRSGITIEAAVALQGNWESQVLSSPTNRYRSEDSKKIYGPEGIVSTFVNAEIDPFLVRKVDGAQVATWNQKPFPFTEDFLGFLSESEEWAMNVQSSLTAERSVLLRSNPPRVNVDAHVRPESVTVTLLCQDATWQLVNRNYPQRARFVYDNNKCGKVDLRIAFPSFTLTRTYPDFVSFIEIFQYGEHDFTPSDFPDSSGILNRANVNSIKIRIIPDGAAALLKERSARSSTVPELITYARE
ncbi:MAG: hypothetical protein LBL72_09865 [Candidatus Accumulibacter sp.]|jgi:hypothetical protein|nr:hypothetical protein [Accumulibacter sp.]